MHPDQSETDIPPKNRGARNCPAAEPRNYANASKWLDHPPGHLTAPAE